MQELVNEQVQHLVHSHTVLAQNCIEALRALQSFEHDYVVRPDAIVSPLSPPERLRVAVGHILEVCEHHVLAVEELEARQQAL